MAGAGAEAAQADLLLHLPPGSRLRGLAGVDPTRGQAELTFKNCKAEPLGAANEGWSIVSQVLDRAAVLTAFEQVGGSDRALEMGRDYALDRIAFGRPIGSYQAVKHLVANAQVAVESMQGVRTVLGYGAQALCFWRRPTAPSSASWASPR